MSEEVWIKIKKASHVLIAEVWYWFIILILSTFVIMLDKKFKSILFTISNFQILTITENLVCNSKICRVTHRTFSGLSLSRTISIKSGLNSSSKYSAVSTSSRG